jgi:filamentous hemagglutinin
MLSSVLAVILFDDDPRDAGRALEAMKKDNGIPNNHQGKIMSNGDYIDAHTGEVLGNILDYKP